MCAVYAQDRVLNNMKSPSFTDHYFVIFLLSKSQVITFPFLRIIFAAVIKVLPAQM